MSRQVGNAVRNFALPNSSVTTCTSIRMKGKTTIMIIFLLLPLLFNFGCNQDCVGVTLVSRQFWNSSIEKTAAISISQPREKVTFIVIHETNTRPCTSRDECKETLQEIEMYDMKTLRMVDINMNFFIGGDGTVYEGRGWGVESENVRNHSTSLGIAFMGSFTNAPVPTAMYQAAQNLFLCGVNQGMIYPHYSLYGHRDLENTTCPGDRLYAEIKKHPAFDRIRILRKTP